MKNYLRYKLQINIILLIITFISTISVGFAVVKPATTDTNKQNDDKTTLENIDNKPSSDEIAQIKEKIDQIAFEEQIAEEPVVLQIPTTVIVRNTQTNDKPINQPSVNKTTSTSTPAPQPTKTITPIKQTTTAPKPTSKPVVAKPTTVVPKPTTVAVAPKPTTVPKPTTAAS